MCLCFTSTQSFISYVSLLHSLITIELLLLAIHHVLTHEIHTVALGTVKTCISNVLAQEGKTNVIIHVLVYKYSFLINYFIHPKLENTESASYDTAPESREG